MQLSNIPDQRRDTRTTWQIPRLTKCTSTTLVTPSHQTIDDRIHVQLWWRFSAFVMANEFLDRITNIVLCM